MRTLAHTTAPRARSPQRVLGRYDLIEVIGRGATSRVYRALDRATGHEVAVKEIPVDLGLEKRVAAEIRAAARLQHQSVVRMLDWGEDAESLYLVSELVDGPSLEAVYSGAPPGDRARASPLPQGDGTEIRHPSSASRVVVAAPMPQPSAVIRATRCAAMDVSALLPAPDYPVRPGAGRLG